jgi:hypothetical protein
MLWVNCIQLVVQPLLEVVQCGPLLAGGPPFLVLPFVVLGERRAVQGGEQGLDARVHVSHHARLHAVLDVAVQVAACESKELKPRRKSHISGAMKSSVLAWIQVTLSSYGSAENSAAVQPHLEFAFGNGKDVAQHIRRARLEPDDDDFSLLDAIVHLLVGERTLQRAERLAADEHAVDVHSRATLFPVGIRDAQT